MLSVSVVDGLIEFPFEVNRLPLVRCLASRDAGEVSNNRGHPTTVLDDVAGIGSDAVEVGFFSDGFSQSENSERADCSTHVRFRR